LLRRRPADDIRTVTESTMTAPTGSRRQRPFVRVFADIGSRPAGRRPLIERGRLSQPAKQDASSEPSFRRSDLAWRNHGGTPPGGTRPDSQSKPGGPAPKFDADNRSRDQHGPWPNTTGLIGPEPFGPPPPRDCFARAPCRASFELRLAQGARALFLPFRDGGPEPSRTEQSAPPAPRG